MSVVAFQSVQETNILVSLRTAAPSGGRLYPLTLYVIASETVGGIVSGPYKYLPVCHALLPMGVAQCPPQQGEVDDECECEDDGGEPARAPAFGHTRRARSRKAWSTSRK